MIDWKTNKVVGIVAGILSILSVVLIIKGLTVKPKPQVIEGGNILETPANTPFIKR